MKVKRTIAMLVTGIGFLALAPTTAEAHKMPTLYAKQQAQVVARDWAWNDPNVASYGVGKCQRSNAHKVSCDAKVKIPYTVGTCTEDPDQR